MSGAGGTKAGAVCLQITFRKAGWAQTSPSRGQPVCVQQTARRQAGDGSSVSEPKSISELPYPYGSDQRGSSSTASHGMLTLVS